MISVSKKEEKSIFEYLSYVLCFVVALFVFNYLVFNNEYDFNNEYWVSFYSLFLLCLLLFLVAFVFFKFDFKATISNKVVVAVFVIFTYFEAALLGKTLYKMAFDNILLVKTENSPVKYAYVIAAGGGFILGRYVDNKDGFFIERGGYSIKMAE